MGLFICSFRCQHMERHATWRDVTSAPSLWVFRQRHIRHFFFCFSYRHTGLNYSARPGPVRPVSLTLHHQLDFHYYSSKSRVLHLKISFMKGTSIIRFSPSIQEKMHLLGEPEYLNILNSDVAGPADRWFLGTARFDASISMPGSGRTACRPAQNTSGRDT